MADKHVETLSVGLAGGSATDDRSGPATGTEQLFAEVLAGVVQSDDVSVDSNFFEDLGANSLLMAQFCARVRKQPALPTVSMKDVYRHPTVRSLATALGGAPAPVAAAPVVAAVAEPEPARVGTARYLLCGGLQLLFFLAYSVLVAIIAGWAYDWIAAGTGLLDYYVRSVIFGGAILAVLCVLPIIVKWLFVGRWRATEIEVWTLRYVRFWIVKTLIQRNLVVLLFVGTPLYSLYLRALGAKIGSGVMILSRQAPVCTDLLTIGDDTVIRKDCFLSGYHVHAGVIRTGPISIGRDVFVGEMTVIDIDASMGDGSQLGHTSSLHPGQRMPDGEHWHGSPAQRTDADYRTVPPARCGSVRKFTYTAQQVLTALVIYMPLTIGGVDLLLTKAPQLDTLLGGQLFAFSTWQFYLHALITSAVIFFGLLIVGLLLELVVPRLLNLPLEPMRVYRLYGFHYSLLRGIRFLTNLKTFKSLFGDSSAIVGYLRGIGYRMPAPVQTGSNFGTQVKHETPFQSTVGSGTMVADGLSLINAEYSATSFRLADAAIGPRNFLGNHIAYPAGGRTGGNCLLATKVMVPIDGPVRENVGLLGSPSFEIPRTVERDTNLSHTMTRAQQRRGLHAKNRHNTVTALGFLLVRWLYFYAIMLAGWATDDLYVNLGPSVIAMLSVVLLLFSIVFFVLVERLVTVFLPLRPLNCSIYDKRFWRHERFWKAAASTAHIMVLNGTPFKTLVWRMLGVRVGKRLFDDGASMPEKTLVTIGDDVTLNAGSIIQCHSQEDGAFKSDRITVGSGCTVGVAAWVHYGVTMGDRAVLAPDSFLMKGEEVPSGTRWGGNPAIETRDR